jgi:preprotein translocase subunit SecD
VKNGSKGRLEIPNGTNERAGRRLPLQCDSQTEIRGLHEHNIRHSLAIVLDNRAISVLLIKQPITLGIGQISGRFTVAEAESWPLS